jgi:hypothetical protein
MNEEEFLKVVFYVCLISGIVVWGGLLVVSGLLWPVLYPDIFDDVIVEWRKFWE